MSDDSPDMRYILQSRRAPAAVTDCSAGLRAGAGAAPGCTVPQHTRRLCRGATGISPVLLQDGQHPTLSPSPALALSPSLSPLPADPSRGCGAPHAGAIAGQDDRGEEGTGLEWHCGRAGCLAWGVV